MDAAQIVRLENNPMVTIKFAWRVDGQSPAPAAVECHNLFADPLCGWKATVPESTATGTNNDRTAWQLTHCDVAGAIIAVKRETGLAIFFEVARALEADALKCLVGTLWKRWSDDVGELPSSIIFEGVGKDSPNGRVRAKVCMEVPSPVTGDEIALWVDRFQNRFHSILKPMEWVAPPRKPNYHDLVWAAAAGQVRQLVYERAEFESQVAEITDAYWPHHKKIGAAVMVRHRSRRHLLRFREQVRLERITGDVNAADWLDVFQKIDELAVRAHYALRGMSQQTAVHSLFSVASQVYRRFDVDDQEEPLNAGCQEDGDENGKNTKNDRHELKKTPKQQQCERLRGISDFINRAADHEARLVYVGGMVFGIFVLALLVGFTSIAWPISGGNTGIIDRSLLFGCAIAGAFGAIVSVLTQIRSIRANAEVGRGYVRLLGGVRPFIGAIFGAVLYVALDSGLVAAAAKQSADVKRFPFFLTFAFIAGFSERFARDTLTSIGSNS